MVCRSAPYFPELREQFKIMTRLKGQGLQLFSQSVRQYLIERPEWFALHCCPLALRKIPGQHSPTRAILDDVFLEAIVLDPSRKEVKSTT
jgi:hypothetical protein